MNKEKIFYMLCPASVIDIAPYSLRNVMSSNNYNYIGGTDGWSFFFSSLSNLAWSIDDADGNPHGNSSKSISNCIMFSASTVEIHNTKYKPGWIHTYEVRKKYLNLWDLRFSHECSKTHLTHPQFKKFSHIHIVLLTHLPLRGFPI